MPTTFLRAAMILGSGSASFEILRYLVERLPVMITPRWVDTQAQPIGIRNVLYYLQGCLEHDEVLGQTFDIGGPEIVSYRQLFQIFAEEAGLPKRIIVPVPFFTPKLSSYWIHLVTPVPASIARPLAEGLRNAVVCQDNRILDIIPQDLLDCRQTIRLALERVEQERIDTCWMDAGANRSPGMDLLRGYTLRRGNNPGIGLRRSNSGFTEGGLGGPGENRREDRLVFRHQSLENPGLV